MEKVITAVLEGRSYTIYPIGTPGTMAYLVSPIAIDDDRFVKILRLIGDEGETTGFNAVVPSMTDDEITEWMGAARAGLLFAQETELMANEHIDHNDDSGEEQE